MPASKEKEMDAISLLTADHKAVKKLFREFEDAGKRASSKKQTLFDEIRTELMIHTAIEEEIFYPGVRSEAEELIAEAFQEHHVVDVLIDEITRLSPEDEAFEAKITVLMENVEHHADEEEKELFPKVKRAMGVEKMREFGEKMSIRKEELQAAAKAA